ncbi:uncharacterized protein LOC101221478 [Cucumis sativus]|uniref:DUF1218 domain-containing protein n=1 Tax=Cucumis sativus TaxID=3659 RepID=A0A0A0KU80_CUCSA|nr:uncharacterized protein LOC101221478 [Cucumis sativus]KGN53195.1 hypothetical protein Csa_014613 [Cucumis sativus]
MERKSALMVKYVVAILGIVMIATGFAAEATRTKRNQVTKVAPDLCKYPRSPALGLGLTAALSLLFAQITIKASTGCVCCIRGPRPPASKWRTAVICFTISWVTYVIAFLLFLTGAALNNGRGEQRNYFRDYDCYVLKPGVFSFATIVGMASLTLGMSYFLILNSAKNDPSTVWGHPSVPPQPNIAMAQPQFPNPPPPPQRTADPVFVHEDTYMRRQFT